MFTDVRLAAASACVRTLPTCRGARPRQRIVDSDSVNGLSFLPRSVVVAGSGIIAIEMARTPHTALHAH